MTDKKVTKVTPQWLTSKDACASGKAWVKEHGQETDPMKLMNLLIRHDKLDWANWLIVQLLPYQGYVRYACYGAKQVLPIWEQQYPDDKSPHEAIAAALRCARNPTEANCSAADSAASSAADSAYSAADSAYRAASAAFSAAFSAAYSAASAASAASAFSAASAAYSTEWKAMLTKILRYGMRLWRQG